MRKTVLTFGLMSGAVSAATMLATIPFADAIGWEKGEILGYTMIVLSALMVFFGVRSYRENAGGGRLTFGRGFAVGILITLISSACYVGTWEIVYFKLMPGFAEKYAAHMVERAKASGASQQKMDETERQATVQADVRQSSDQCSPDVHGGFSDRPGGHAALGRDSPEEGARP